MPPIQPKRKSFLLTVDPINISLTEGTDIPPPPPSPPSIISRTSKPITLLSQKSPPTSPAATDVTSGMPGAFPTEHPAPAPAPAPAPPTATARKTSISTTDTAAAPRTRADSFRTPLSPSSASTTRPGPRRMFSLHSLRQSFSSSRTSLMLPSRDSHDALGVGAGRPQSPGGASMMTNGTKRTRRSSGWFGRGGRRGSSFWGGGEGGGGGGLGVLSEDPRESKRVKAAPLLPDVGTLRGGRLNGGGLGWDEGMFQEER